MVLCDTDRLGQAMSKIGDYVFKQQEQNEFNEDMNGENHEHSNDDIGRIGYREVNKSSELRPCEHVINPSSKETASIPFERLEASH